MYFKNLVISAISNAPPSPPATPTPLYKSMLLTPPE